MTNFVPKTADAQVMSDIDHTVAFASGDGGDTDRLGATGFCWGGRIVWLYAAHNPALDAGVAFYGRLTGKTDALHPKSPIDSVKDIKRSEEHTSELQSLMRKSYDGFCYQQK